MKTMHKLAAVLALGLAASFAPATGRAQDVNAVAVSANDQMKYTVTQIDASLGQKLAVTLTNEGSLPKTAMAHNFIILKPGTDVAAFIAAAKAATPESDYIPAEKPSMIVVHTKLLGPGESDTVNWTPHVAGTYDFVCTYPAHYEAGMHGTITVK